MVEWALECSARGWMFQRVWEGKGSTGPINRSVEMCPQDWQQAKSCCNGEIGWMSIRAITGWRILCCVGVGEMSRQRFLG